MASNIVAGELYGQITGQLFEIGRQLRQKNGYPFEAEHLKKWLQMAVEGKFRFYPPRRLKVPKYDPDWIKTQRGPEKIGVGTYRIYKDDEKNVLRLSEIDVASIMLANYPDRSVHKHLTYQAALRDTLQRTDIIPLDARVCQAMLYEKDQASLEWLRLTQGITTLKFARTRVMASGGGLAGRPLVLCLFYRPKERRFCQPDDGWDLQPLEDSESNHISWACLQASLA